MGSRTACSRPRPRPNPVLFEIKAKASIFEAKAKASDHKKMTFLIKIQLLN